MAGLFPSRSPISAADRPSDVYTYVADMVERQIEQDVKNDDPVAKLVSGKVSRKVVKQTVSAS